MDPHSSQPLPDILTRQTLSPVHQRREMQIPISIQKDDPRRESPLFTLTKVLILTSIIVFPCFAIRKLSVMNKKVEEIGRVNVELQRDLRHMTQVLAARRVENIRLTRLLEETRDEVSKLRSETREMHTVRGQKEERLREYLAESKGELNKLGLQAAQRDAALAESQTVLREEIRKLVYDRDQAR